jgi:hypothetical protein
MSHLHLQLINRNNIPASTTTHHTHTSQTHVSGSHWRDAKRATDMNIISTVCAGGLRHALEYIQCNSSAIRFPNVSSGQVEVGR